MEQPVSPVAAAAAADRVDLLHPGDQRMANARVGLRPPPAGAGDGLLEQRGVGLPAKNTGKKAGNIGFCPISAKLERPLVGLDGLKFGLAGAGSVRGRLSIRLRYA